jgi:hypothetical protein
MRIHIYYMVCMVGMLLCCFKAGAVQAQERFFETLYDVPIMSGLVEMPEQGLNFDTPGGRIAEAAAAPLSGAKPNKAVIEDFYAQTLPQMGWKKQAGGMYVREDEKLRIFYRENHVVFRLEPQ